MPSGRPGRCTRQSGNNITFPITIGTEFAKYTTHLSEVDTSNGNNDLYINFPVGTYYLYNLQLERASSPSDWRPAPEDSEDYAKKMAEEESLAAVNAQTQLDIFNRLTNGGDVQGIYLKDGKVYINGTYMQTGTITVKRGDKETFYANVDTGEVKIVADEFSLSNGKTIEDIAEDAVEGQTQQEIFDKLTGGGATQGIYLSGGKVYINASYIQSGTIDADDVNIINLIADRLQSYGNNNTWMLDSQASYLDIRELVNAIWKQRVGIFISNDGGVVRVSSGDVDANGEPLTGDSKRSYLSPNAVRVGLDQDGNYTGTVSTGFINANTIGKALATTTLTAANSSWTFSVNGVRFLLITGQTSRVERYTAVIPVANLSTSELLYGWTDTTGTTQFGISKSGSTCTVTLKSFPSGGRLVSAYSII